MPPPSGNNAYTTPTLGPNAGEAVETVAPVKTGDVFICLLPACCDLGGTTLSGIGLLFTTASVFQMLRGERKPSPICNPPYNPPLIQLGVIW